jgi:hypothetical protein
MSISDDIFEKVEPQPDIYDNSKSYEWPFELLQSKKEFNDMA